MLQDKATQRINTFCKLLYCRFIGPSVADDVGNSSFELFVTDSSLQNATQFVGRSEGSLPYVKIMGKSCHMLPPELRQVRTNYGMNLSAKLLLLKAPGMLIVILFFNSFLELVLFISNNKNYTS